MRALLKKRPDVNEPGSDGTPALHWVVRMQDADTAQQLLRAGADPDLANRYGVRPLHVAIATDDLAVVRLLLQAGANPDSTDATGDSCLVMAVRAGQLPIVEALLEKGAKADSADPVFDQTPLMVAARTGSADIVRLLLARGARVDAQTRTGKVPAFRLPGSNSGSKGQGIVRGGWPERGERDSIPGAKTPLLYATRDGRLEVAQLLVQAGADIEKADADGVTPLLMSILNGQVPVARYLLDHGANVRATDWYGQTPLFAAVDLRNLDVTGPTRDNGVDRAAALQLVQALLDRSPDVNARTREYPPQRRWITRLGSLSWVDFTGQTPFLRAALAGDVTVMRLLLEHGADANIATFNGTTPLMAAAGVNWTVSQTFDEGPAALLEAVQTRLCQRQRRECRERDGAACHPRRRQSRFGRHHPVPGGEGRRDWHGGPRGSHAAGVGAGRVPGDAPAGSQARDGGAAQAPVSQQLEVRTLGDRKMIGRRTIGIVATLVLISLAAEASAQSGLQLTVYTGRGVDGYDVNSTLVSGEKDMLLIDAQLTLSEAHRLAAEILESKKNLAIIYITHPHPDHMFGLAVLKQAFPQVRILALPQTVAAAKTGWPNRQKFWLPTYGNNIPGPEPVLPEELTDRLPGRWKETSSPSSVRLAAATVRATASCPSRSSRPWSPATSCSTSVYFGVQKDKNREEWLKSIDQIVALKPEIIVPGHEGPRSTRNLATIAFMKKYVADWDANVARSKNAEEMKKNTLKKYPKLGMDFALDSRIAAYFPATGASTGNEPAHSDVTRAGHAGAVTAGVNATVGDGAGDACCPSTRRASITWT